MPDDQLALREPAARDDRRLLRKLWLRSPLGIATWSPSSPAIAGALTSEVDPDAEDPVLELGAGTGPVTQAILDRGLPPDKLIAMEKVPELCAVLRERFPGIRVIEGDVADLGRVLGEMGVEKLSLTISTLPIIWFPLALQRSIVDAAFARMNGQGRFMQMTNQMTSPLPRRKLGLEGRPIIRVWRDLPPTSAWAYTRA